VVSQTATLGLRRLVLRLLASETSSFAKDARPRRHVLLSISITRPGSRLRLASVSPVPQVHHLHSPSLRLPHRRHSPSTATHGPISRLPLHDPFLPPSSPSGDAAVDAHSHSALTSAKRNLRYLYSPTSSTAQPARFRTRALLRPLRFTPIFVFWRLVRYAKYVFGGANCASRNDSKRNCAWWVFLCEPDTDVMAGASLASHPGSCPPCRGLCRCSAHLGHNQSEETHCCSLLK
jgi:hypothetical protein